MLGTPLVISPNETIGKISIAETAAYNKTEFADFADPNGLLRHLHTDFLIGWHVRIRRCNSRMRRTRRWLPAFILRRIQGIHRKLDKGAFATRNPKSGGSHARYEEKGIEELCG